MARKLGGIVSMDTIGMALGAATSGIITGLIPIPDFGISGVSEILVGWAGQKFLGKKGIMKSYFKGIMIAGIANAISGFIPQIGGTIHPIKGQMQQQVDGAQGHAFWKGGQPGRPVGYIKRNPVTLGTHTQTETPPHGTKNLYVKLPYVNPS